MKARPRMVRIDPKKIEVFSNALGIANVGALAKGTGIPRSTLNRYLRDEEMPIDRLESLANRLGTTPESLMPISSFAQKAEPPFKIVAPDNFDVLEIVSPISSAANGLSYCIAKLESQLNAKHVSRGKFYWLAGVDQRNQPKLRECLNRHGVVCESCKNALRIARHRIAIPLEHDTAWWVLDHWIDGSPLDSLIYPWQELPHSLIKHLGTEILLGLDELHSYGIVMRELTPDKVIVSEDQQKCILTDFEMAILTQGTVSVSGRWKTRSPYLAPENVDDSDYYRKPQIVKSRDIYSWAAIMIELLTGDPLADDKRLSECLRQSEIAKFLMDCRHPRADLRPKVVAEVLEVWNKW